MICQGGLVGLQLIPGLKDSPLIIRDLRQVQQNAKKPDRAKTFLAVMDLIISIIRIGDNFGDASQNM
jgi:hypothetical protein